MWDRLARTVAPAVPVSLQDFRAHSRVAVDDPDASLMEHYLATAAALVEGPGGVGFCLNDQTWTLTLDRFSDPIEIPLRPVTSIVTVAYLDGDGASQVVDAGDYRLLKAGRLARVEPVEAWPATAQDRLEAVIVTFKAGSGVPPEVKQFIILAAAYWYENREAGPDLPRNIFHLVEPYRSQWVAA